MQQVLNLAEGRVSSIKQFVYEKTNTKGIVLSFENRNQYYTLSMALDECSSRFLSDVQKYGLMDVSFCARFVLLDTKKTRKLNPKIITCPFGTYGSIFPERHIFNCSLINYTITTNQSENFLSTPRFMIKNCLETDLDLEWDIMKFY